MYLHALAELHRQDEGKQIYGRCKAYPCMFRQYIADLLQKLHSLVLARLLSLAANGDGHRRMFQIIQHLRCHSIGQQVLPMTIPDKL